ncbi:hypothetical protein BASA81_000358 [Batrachochytrium salamandrivorans]|nr:hypothetical protein BASA81_000358 [Batrachochytrium salamandrivorans]
MLRGQAPGMRPLSKLGKGVGASRPQAQSRLGIPSRNDFNVDGEEPALNPKRARQSSSSQPSYSSPPCSSQALYSTPPHPIPPSLSLPSQDRVAELERQNSELQLELACLRSESQSSSLTPAVATAATVVVVAEPATVADASEVKLGELKRELEARKKKALKLDRFQQQVLGEMPELLACRAWVHNYLLFTAGKLNVRTLPTCLLPVLVLGGKQESQLAAVRVLYLLAWHFRGEGNEEEEAVFPAQVFVTLCDLLLVAESELRGAILRFFCAVPNHPDLQQALFPKMRHSSAIWGGTDECFALLPFPLGFPTNKETWEMAPCPFTTGNGDISAIRRCNLLLCRFAQSPAAMMGFLLWKNLFVRLVRELYECTCIRQDVQECELVQQLLARAWNAMNDNNVSLANADIQQLLASLLWMQNLSSRPKLVSWASNMFNQLPQS